MASKTNTKYFREECYYRSASAPFPVVDRSTVSLLVSNRNSVPNPKWAQIISDGGNATTAMDAYSMYATVNPGYIQYNMKGADSEWKRNTHMSIVGPYSRPKANIETPEFSTLATKAESIATAMIYKRLAELQTPFQGQVFLGELKEVINLIKHPFAETQKLVQRFATLATNHKSFHKAFGTPQGRKRKLRQLTPLPADISSAWLEFVFAIKPLLDDIQAIIDLAKTVAERREHEIVRGYGKSINSTTSVQNVSAGTTGLNMRLETIVLKQAQCIIRCGLTKEFLDEVRGDTDHIRNSLDDLSTLPTMFWELLPWSFLVDYFVNIGDIISAHTAGRSGISWVSKSVIRTEEIIKVSSNPYIARTDLINAIHSYQPKRAVYGIRGVVRTSTLAGIPPVVFSLPGSKMQYANITALLIQLTK